MWTVDEYFGHFVAEQLTAILQIDLPGSVLSWFCFLPASGLG